MSESQPDRGLTAATTTVAVGRANFDLILLGALIVLTAALGPSFSKVSVGGTTVYVTEILLAATVVAAALRIGIGRGLSALQALPLLPLAIFWVAGVIATVRGIAVEGLSNTLEDVGLFEYSLVLPVIAVVATSAARLDILRKALIGGSAVAIVLYFVSYMTVHFLSDIVEYRAEALTYGTYMALFVTWTANELAHDRRPHPALLTIAAVGLVLIFLTSVRAVWIGTLFGLATVAVLAPSAARIRQALTTVAACAAALAIAVGVQLAENGEIQILTEVEGVAGGISARDAAPLATGISGLESRGGEEDGGGSGPGATGGGGGDEGSGDDGGGGKRVDIPPPSATPESDNTRWRLDFWTESLDRTIEQPLLGAGFGEPFRFVWNGLKYDFRDGDPFASIDTSGNHNSFIYIVYRMGIPALLALIALLAVAAARTLRGDGVPADRSGELTALLAMTAVAIGVALWTDALKSPFLALAFWFPLGLLLVSSARDRAGAAGTRPA